MAKRGAQYGNDNAKGAGGAVKKGAIVGGLFGAGVGAGKGLATGSLLMANGFPATMATSSAFAGLTTGAAIGGAAVGGAA